MRREKEGVGKGEFARKREREIITAVARGGPESYTCVYVCARARHLRIYIIAGKSRNFFIISDGTNTGGGGCP